MPRHPRDYFISDFLHVMVQGDEKKFIFKTHEQKKKYTEYMLEAAAYFEVTVVAYCIMGNHAHLLLYSKDIKNISHMMHQCNTTYGIYYNKNKKVVGHVFRDRFRSENIESKNYLLNCIKYIHQNPVKAGICRKSENYIYSSYREFKSGKKKYLLKTPYFSKEDIEEILENPLTEEEFIGALDEKEDFEKVLTELLKNKEMSMLTSEQLVKMYYQIKKRCNVTDTHVSGVFQMTRSRLRRILEREK